MWFPIGLVIDFRARRDGCDVDLWARRKTDQNQANSEPKALPKLVLEHAGKHIGVVGGISEQTKNNSKKTYGWLRRPGRHFEGLGGPLGPPWGAPFGAVLEPSWRPLGPHWGPLGPSYDCFGAGLGRLGTVLGVSWAVPGVNNLKKAGI